MLVEFDSVEEFARAARDTIDPDPQLLDWYGYITHQEAYQKAIIGDESYVKEAEKFLNQLDVLTPETKAWKVIQSPYGGQCNIGDWLAGSPLPMRRRIRTTSEIAPVNIYVSTTCSMGIKADTMQRRGYAILALLLKLQQIRPIQLYLLTELHGETDGWHYQKIRVESQPLAVGVAAFALCHVGFARHLTYGYAREKDGFNGHWPSGYRQSNYVQKRAERLGLTDQDMILKEAHSNDQLVSQPVEWIKKQLKRYGGVE